jgi:hypothetical protein
MAQKPLLSRDWTKGQKVRNLIIVRVSIFYGGNPPKNSSKNILKKDYEIL